MKKYNLHRISAAFLVVFALLISSCALSDAPEIFDTYAQRIAEEIPPYSGSPYVEINGNIPSIPDGDLTTESFERYSELDYLGRCGEAYACLSTDTMPTEERGAIGMVKPSGWQTAKYEFIDGKYLYNRCHLIGYQLSAENANEKNLITGTRYLNVEGMLPFENEVADYISRTGNHVMYRVLPLFTGKNLIADGVVMEARSVEDDGISFCVYCYNVQPGVEIDYATGDNHSLENDGNSDMTYILNKKSKKFHYPDCSAVASISDKNKGEYTGSRESLISAGYSACGICAP